MKTFILTALLFTGLVDLVWAQQSGASTTPTGANISNADLGPFPYFKTLPNFSARNVRDSVTLGQNQIYFFDGKTFFTIEGKVSAQRLSAYDDKKIVLSEFQIEQSFDKLVSTLGGKKVYKGKLPEDQLKKLANADVVTLVSKYQLAGSAYYGVIEYVVKTRDKEIWLQLVPGTIASGYYSLLIVEKDIHLLTGNITKRNLILEDLEKNGKATVDMVFGLDDTNLQSEAKDELLNIVGVFQAHPEWKLKIEIHNSTVGKAEYILALTQKRAVSLKSEMMGLGIKPASVEIVGLGDTRPLAPGDTEKGRDVNTRLEIIKQ